ncbi:MAG: gamma-glutamylcyclotransferase family protein [Chloroflexota bacterium]
MYYFAYGTDLSKKEMKARCPESQPKFIATLPNHKLFFAGWSRQWRGGVASIQSSRGDKVLGAIYEVTEADLRRLDKYQAGYQRQKVTVFNEDSEPVEAVTYLKAARDQAAPPGPAYLALMQQGYRDWNLV